MTEAGLVDLRARRVEAALDELASLAERERVADLIRAWTTEGSMDDTTHATSIRLDRDPLARLDVVVEALRGTTAARAAGARWGRSVCLRLAVDAGLASMEGSGGASPAPASPAPASPVGRVVEVEVVNAGTRYRVTAWRSPSGAIGAAWADGRAGGLAWGDLSPHAPPARAWLLSHGVTVGDVEGVERALALAWPRVAG